MARQPHPELNFRMGKGRIRERRASGSGLLKLMRRLKLSDEEIKETLEKMKRTPEGGHR